MSNKATFFIDYFEDLIEYPDDIASNPLPINTLYAYVSSAFLNGFINYVEIIKAFVLGRYMKWDDDFVKYEIYTIDKKGQWRTSHSKTKRAAYNKLVKKGAVHHSRLNTAFGDDIVILAETGKKDIYYFFWYDCDCSDCKIGRFQTSDNKSMIIEKFYNFVEEITELNEWDEAKEIPLHYFQGWIKS